MKSTILFSNDWTNFKLNKADKDLFKELGLCTHCFMKTNMHHPKCDIRRARCKPREEN